jgi:DNA-binding transcriptional ArsR family regulator
LDAIEQAQGKAPRMAFYNIAGNEENLRRWEQKLINEWRLVTAYEEDGRQYYKKTELGEHLHRLLKSHEYIGSLFEELIRDRLR